jgi:hypothetical protein
MRFGYLFRYAIDSIMLPHRFDDLDRHTVTGLYPHHGVMFHFDRSDSLCKVCRVTKDVDLIAQLQVFIQLEHRHANVTVAQIKGKFQSLRFTEWLKELARSCYELS